MPLTMEVTTSPRRFAVLIRVDADRELAGLARGLENAESRGTGRVVDHVHALLVLVERELLALARVAEGFGRHAGVLHDDLAVRADALHAGLVAGLELLDERHVHPAHEADLLRVPDHRRDRADEERAFFFLELERRDVRRAAG